MATTKAKGLHNRRQAMSVNSLKRGLAITKEFF